MITPLISQLTWLGTELRSGSIPGWTSTQSFTISEENVLPLVGHLQMIELSNPLE